MVIRIATLMLALCIAPGALPQTAADPAKTTFLSEEVIITGERHVYQLRTEMMDAEKQTYDIFNSLNDEPRFDISCSKHAPTGSRIEKQICLPGFQLEAYQQHALQYLETLRPDGSNFAIQYQPQEVGIASQQEDYRRKLRQVAEEHPEFLDALMRYSEIVERFEQVTSAAP